MTEYILQAEQLLGSDLYLHILIAFTLGFLSQRLAPDRMRFSRFRISWLLVPLMVLLAGDELAQLFISSRQFAVADLVANIGGSAVGAAAAGVMDKMNAQKRQFRLD